MSNANRFSAKGINQPIWIMNILTSKTEISDGRHFASVEVPQRTQSVYAPFAVQPKWTNERKTKTCSRFVCPCTLSLSPSRSPAHLPWYIMLRTLLGRGRGSWQISLFPMLSSLGHCCSSPAFFGFCSSRLRRSLPRTINYIYMPCSCMFLSRVVCRLIVLQLTQSLGFIYLCDSLHAIIYHNFYSACSCEHIMMFSPGPAPSFYI